MQVIKALKDDVIFKKIGIEKPDLRLTASLESQFQKMKKGESAKDVNMDKTDVHSRLYTLDPDTQAHYFDFTSPTHFQTPKSFFVGSNLVTQRSSLGEEPAMMSLLNHRKGSNISSSVTL